MTPNEFLFAGEQFDSDLNLYYNRARYLNVSTGRFWTMDTFEGDDGDGPAYAHKYLYANADGVNELDPSGQDTEVEELGAISVDQILQGLAVLGLLAFNLGILDTNGREPFLSRRDREQNPKKWLYAFGNMQGPRDPRIAGFNLGPNQKPDITAVGGLVGPEVPPLVHGASTWSNPETAPATGQVWKTERQAIETAPGLGVFADGDDAVPPGPNPTGHHTVYPTVGMKPEGFIWLFKSLPWRHVYNKKTMAPVILS